MEQDGISQVDRATKLLNENPGLKIVRGEFGDITFTQRNPQKLDEISQVIHAALTREPTTEKTGMTIRVSDPSQPGRRTQIDIFPDDDKKGYYVARGSEIDLESVFKIIRNGIGIVYVYQHYPPAERKDLFLIKDPSDPYAGENIFEDILRQDADYLEFASDEEPKPEEVVEKIASRKTARRIGLTSIEGDPLPSEHILVMQQLLSRQLEGRTS